MVATKGSRSFSLLHSSPPVIVVSSTGSHHGSLGTVNAVDFGDDDDDHPPTAKADVYAFGIILFEIMGRKGPWGIREMSQEQLCSKEKQLS